MHERLSGRLAQEPETNWGPGFKQSVRLRMAVDDPDGETAWYDVVASGKDLKRFASELEKGSRITVDGETTVKTYIDKKSGESRMRRVLRAVWIEFAGVRVEREKETRAGDAEEAERVYKAQRQETLRQYPPRWEKPGIEESPVYRQAVADHPEAWEQDSDGDGWVGQEEIRELLGRLSMGRTLAGRTGDAIAGQWAAGGSDAPHSGPGRGIVGAKHADRGQQQARHF